MATTLLLCAANMNTARFAFLFAASLGLAACQGSVSTESSGDGGSGGSTSTSTNTKTSTDTTTSTTTSTTTTVVCEPPANPADFDIGTGEKCFEPVDEAGVVPLMSGPQGGYHMWLAVGCDDCGTAAHIKYGALDPATNQPLAGTAEQEQMAQLTNDAWPQRAGIVVYMPGLSWDPMNEPPPAKGSQLILWADTYAPDGTPVHHATRLVTVGDTLDWNPCAENPNDPSCGLDGGP